LRPFPFAITPKDVDEKFMLEALREAWKAYNENEVPVGAVLVKNGEILARGYNQVETLQDATAHAEMLCLTSAEAAEFSWRLTDTVLYCTLEPCSMCAGALFLTRVKEVVWGAKDLRHGANGSFVDLFATPHPIHKVEVRSGVLAEYAQNLMQQFFRERRNERVE